ncbi:MAG: hypothetical protein HFE73_08745 [Firmicutes bacterium]|nr:hypothetical protein [Bacillota bacterium]
MKKKKCIIIIVMIVLVLQCSVSYAGMDESLKVTFEEVYNKTNEMFQFVNQHREEFDLPIEGQLYLADAIESYQIVDGKILDNGASYFPVVDSTDKVYGLILAIKNEKKDDVYINFTNEFCEEINGFKKSNVGICMIVDELENVYIGDGQKIDKVQETDIVLTDNDLIESVIKKLKKVKWLERKFWRIQMRWQ